MRTIRRLLTAGSRLPVSRRLPVGRLLPIAAAAVLLAIGPASIAQASGPPQIPADCTVSPAGSDGDTMTCTARPPTQVWRIEIFCTYWTHPIARFGNNVTGNGTSEAHCGLDTEPDGAFFQIVS